MTTVDYQSPLFEQAQADTRPFATPEQGREFSRARRSTTGLKYRASDSERQLRTRTQANVGGYGLLDVDAHTAVQAVVRDHRQRMLTCTFARYAVHFELSIRCRTDDRRDVSQGQPDAAETAPATRTRIEKAEMQTCRCFNARGARRYRHRSSCVGMGAWIIGCQANVPTAPRTRSARLTIRPARHA